MSVSIYALLKPYLSVLMLFLSSCLFKSKDSEYYLLSLNWTLFFFFKSVVLSFIKHTVKYLGINVEPRPRETCRRWCQAVSENNNDSNSICWPRWEQLLMPSAFSIFSLTFPMPETWKDTQTHFYSLTIYIDFLSPIIPFLQHIISNFTPHLSAFNNTKTHDYLLTSFHNYSPTTQRDSLFMF